MRDRGRNTLSHGHYIKARTRHALHHRRDHSEYYLPERRKRLHRAAPSDHGGRYDERRVHQRGSVEAEQEAEDNKLGIWSIKQDSDIEKTEEETKTEEDSTKINYKEIIMLLGIVIIMCMFSTKYRKKVKNKVKREIKKRLK